LTPSDGTPARDPERLLRVALDATRRGSAILEQAFRDPTLAVETKPDGTPVTRADRDAEEAIRTALREGSSEFGIVGEEFGAEGPDDARWIVDPLDGTKSFTAGIPVFAILLALQVEGRVTLGLVHAPIWDQTWLALRGGGAWAGRGLDPDGARGHRLAVSEIDRLDHAMLCHGGLVHFQRAGLWPGFTRTAAAVRRTRGFGDFWGHVLVAEGRADAMADPLVAFHDVAPMTCILEEAGGEIIHRSDAALDVGFAGPVLSSNRALAAAFRDSLML
jgi:histidinol-phosphatase